MSILAQLKNMTVVVADTGDFHGEISPFVFHKLCTLLQKTLTNIRNTFHSLVGIILKFKVTFGARSEWT